MHKQMKRDTHQYIKLVKTELIIITYDKLNKLYVKIPKWQKICKDIADIKTTKLLERTNQFQTQTAKH